MKHGLETRRGVRFTRQQRMDFDHHCELMGVPPGTMLRHLALAWMAERMKPPMERKLEQRALESMREEG